MVSVRFIKGKTSKFVNTNANHTLNGIICQPACFFSESLYNSSNMGQVQDRIHIRRLPWKSVVFLAVGLVVFGWVINTPGGLLGKADAIGYAVCHRIDVRSFHLGERQLPLCARCTGMFLGALLGLVYQGWKGRHRSGMPPRSILVFCGFLVAAFAIDGVNSFMNLIPGAPSIYEPQNWLRLLTGTGMGLVISIAVFPAFNQTVCADWDKRPAIEGWRSMGSLIALSILMDLLVLSENLFVLYPLALASAAGVVVLLVMIYTMVLVMAFRRDNRYQSLQQLAVPLAGCLMLAVLQIAFFDFLRYMLTGTWDGFHIG